MKKKVYRERHRTNILQDNESVSNNIINNQLDDKRKKIHTRKLRTIQWNQQ